MSQSYLNYRCDGYEPEDNYGPPGLADTYPNRFELSSQVRKLIAYLKPCNKPLTKRDMIPWVDWNGYLELKQLLEDSYVMQKYPKNWKARERDLIKKVGNTLSQHRKELLLALNEFGPQKGKAYLYENADIIAPVEVTEAGAYMFSLHHPERKLPYEIIDFALEIYVEHAEKQQQPSKIFASLKAGAEAADIYNSPLLSSIRPNGITPDIATPDEEMNAFFVK